MSLKKIKRKLFSNGFIWGILLLNQWPAELKVLT